MHMLNPDAELAKTAVSERENYLGSIRELVSDGKDVDLSAWTAAMLPLATERALLERLQKGIRPVRTMSDVGREMAALYRELIEMDWYAA